MINIRLFNSLLVAVLFLMVVLTIQSAIETTEIAMAAGYTSDNARQVNAATCIWSEVDRHSIRSEYLEEIGLSLLRTDRGFTGYDGGLIYLLSGSHACQVERN